MSDDGFGIFDDEPLVKKPEIVQEKILPIRKDEQFLGVEEEKEDTSYLFFHIARQTYATKLLSIQEIIEVPVVKPVPRTASFLAGVFNLRGEVSGLINLGNRFGHGDTSVSKHSAVLVFATQHGAIGALVDQIDGVKDIKKEHIKSNTTIKTRVNDDYLGGFLHLQDDLVIVIDLQKLLDEDEFSQVESAIRA